MGRLADVVNRAIWEEICARQRRENDIEREVRMQNTAAGHGGDQAAAAGGRRGNPRAAETQELRLPAGPSLATSGQARCAQVPRDRLSRVRKRCRRWSDHRSADWDHLQEAQALAACFEDFRQSGASDAKLPLVLARLQQLIPWLLQWHNDVNPDFGVRMDDYFRDYVTQEAWRLGKTEEDLKSSINE